MEGELADVVRAQFLVAQYGINITESNRLAIFEFDAILNLAVEHEKRKLEEIENSK